MHRIENSGGQPGSHDHPRGCDVGVLGLVAQQSLTWKTEGKILKEMVTRQPSIIFDQSDHFSSRPVSWYGNSAP